jgi:hypothetical protein
MGLIRRNESHFEHALRLTNSLKDNEFECIKFTSDNGSVYIDSKTVLDILYDEIVAEEETEDTPEDTSKAGRIAELAKEQGQRVAGEMARLRTGGFTPEDECACSYCVPIRDPWEWLDAKRELD